MKTFIVIATNVSIFEDLDQDDQDCIDMITDPFEVECDTEDQALDSYHETIPISCLEDFDITIEEKVAIKK